MSRIDQLIDVVRTRFLLQRFLNCTAWTFLAAACVVIVLTLISRMFLVPLPPRALILGGAAVLAVGVALIIAIATSPSREATATRIDEVLKLNERFSTALLSRDSSDPFARAAVLDAEQTAQSVSVKNRFPFTFPRSAYYAMGAVLLLVITDVYMPQWDLLGKQEQQRKQAAVERRKESAEKALREALAEVMSIPRVGAYEKTLEAARREIEALLHDDIKDATEAIKTAQSALKEAEAARQKIEDLQRYADAEVQKEAFKALATQSPDGALAGVQKSLSGGKFDEAATQLKAMVNDFAAADAEKQREMAAQMKGLAEQMRELAQDPNIQQRIQKELEKQGATPEQARRMTDEMMRAAAGDRNAQQRVRDMAENLARQANNGVLPAPEQLANLMDKINQMQGQANMQSRAGDLAQAASQLANAMQQQAQANQENQPGQNQQGAQAKNAQGQSQQGGAQPQKSAGQQGGQQSGQGQSGEALADAQQAMEAALAELDAMRQAADAAQASSGSSGEGEGGGDEGDGWGQGEQAGNGGGWGEGQGQVPSGPNMGGVGAGERPRGAPAPYTVKKELSPGEVDERGRAIASWLVKADSVKGESKEQFKQIVMSAQRDQAEDVDQDRIPMRAQKAVRDYFKALEDEVK